MIATSRCLRANPTASLWEASRRGLKNTISGDAAITIIIVIIIINIETPLGISGMLGWGIKPLLVHVSEKLIQNRHRNV